MKTLSKIKQDLEFNKSLSTLIETLKTIAVAQYRALEQRVRTFKDFLLTIESFLEFIDIRSVRHPFLNPQNKRQVVVAVTSDSGFLGGLNMQVVNTAAAELDKIPGKLIVIGERGKMYIRGTGVSSVNFPGIRDEERFGQAMQMRDYIVKEILSGGFGYVKVVYPRPVSFTVQHVEVVSFLPFVSSNVNMPTQEVFADIIYESSAQDSVEYMVYLWMGQKLYEIFGLSRLAEFAARYVHLEESAQKLKDIDKKVKLEYFRVRHELIDRTMRELFAGRLLYAHK
jgi:ATP synthase F1 gamma subunit